MVIRGVTVSCIRFLGTVCRAVHPFTWDGAYLRNCARQYLKEQAASGGVDGHSLHPRVLYVAPSLSDCRIPLRLQKTLQPTFKIYATFNSIRYIQIAFAPSQWLRATNWDHKWILCSQSTISRMLYWVLFTSFQCSSIKIGYIKYIYNIKYI
jgi:hypothetical protein